VVSIPERNNDQQAETDEEIFQECRERLRIAIEAETENRAQAITALEFRDGHQWPDDLYNQRKIDKRPSITVNHTSTLVRRVVNNMREQRPRIKVHPVGTGANTEVANVIAGLVRHIENISQASVAYDTAGEAAVTMGWGYWRILSEYISPDSFDQELKIVAIRNPFTVYMDPSSNHPAGEDADWVIISEKMKRQDYKRLYPKAENIEFQRSSQGDDMTEWESKDEIRLAEYYRVYQRMDTLHFMSNGMGMFRDEIKKLSTDLEQAQITETSFSRPSVRRTVEWFKLNGKEIVDRRSHDENPLPDRWIPVIRCEGNVLDVNGEVRRKGMVADLMDPARMLNYWKTCETEMLALAPKSPFIGPAGAFDGHPEWADANQKSYSRLEYDPQFIEQPDGSKTPLPPPERSPPIAVPQGFVQAAQGAFQDLMAIAGMPHDPQMDQPGTVISGQALRRRQAISDMAHYQYYDNQTLSICQTGKCLVQLIPYYYSTQRMQRIIGEDGVPEMAAINTKDPATNKVKNDLKVGRYDVVMDTGPGYETKRLEQAEMTVDMLRIAPLAEVSVKNGADLIYRYFGMDEMADRLVSTNPTGFKKTLEQLPKEARSVVQSLYNQLQAAQQTIQHQALDLKYRGSIKQMEETEETKRELMRGHVKAHDTDTMAQTRQLDTHVKAQTSIGVAEINAAGKLMDTQVDKGHEHIMQVRELEHAASQAEEK